jgi:hypothetical protein
VVLASLAVMLALVVAYARQAAVDSNQLANRATVALHDDSVRLLIAQKVTDELVLRNEADLIAARPIIESVASEIVGGRAFTSLFRKAVRDLHRALFKRDRNTVTLTLTDVGTVVAAALEQVRPALADQLQSTKRVELVTSNIGSLARRSPTSPRRWSCSRCSWSCSRSSSWRPRSRSRRTAARPSSSSAWVRWLRACSS